MKLISMYAVMCVCLPENDQYIWYAIVLLEKSLTKSPTNFQLKLLAIQFYARIGEFLWYF